MTLVRLQDVTAAICCGVRSAPTRQPGGALNCCCAKGGEPGARGGAGAGAGAPAREGSGLGAAARGGGEQSPSSSL